MTSNSNEIFVVMFLYYQHFCGLLKVMNNISNINQFPCAQCGAMLKYQPGTSHQSCTYCGYENSIAEKQETIKENDLTSTLEQLSHQEAVKQTEKSSHCDTCGATFNFSVNISAGECPFCGSDIVSKTEEISLIPPKSLLPFSIDKHQAKDKYQQWVKSLWFAPNKLKKYARRETKLIGIYLPYWTYDSQTQSRYQGERGTTYYVSQKVTVVEDGRQVTRTKQVAKIRWCNVSGQVSRFFDDVLINASHSLPRKIVDELEPWDLPALVPYDDKYISGFQSERYQLGLDEGFNKAKQVMANTIRQDIRYDIGGDQQRVHQVNTEYSRMTYKHCLLPVWSSAFLYQKKSYRFVVNGRTGEVQGERPYSYWKVSFALLIITLAIAGSVYVYLEKQGVFDGNYSGEITINYNHSFSIGY